MIKDVIVVGSGAGAMSAALTAAKLGLDVLVVEKNSHIGGTGAMSGGVAWIPNNPFLDTISQRSGERDSRERMLTYFENIVGRGRMRPDLMNAFYDNGRAMVEFLQANSELRFEETTYVDYKAHLPGGMPVGRSISAAGYDGKRLGPWLDKLTPPLKEMCLFDSLMIDGADARQLAILTRSPRAIIYMAGRVMKYAVDKVSHGRGTWLTMGNALLGRMLRSAVDAGVTFWTEASARRLVVENGKVVGLEVDKTGATVIVMARKGVVLGAGGFPHDAELKKQLIPNAEHHETLTPPSNSGDGIRMGLAAGGRLGGNTWHNFLGTQVAMMRDKAGNVISKIPFMRLDRNKPGYVLVNRHGKRFVNEAWPYNDVAHAMNNAEDAVPSYLICDHTRLRRYGLGLVRPGPAWLRRLKPFLENSHLFKADTLDQLAHAIGIDAAGLKDTVAKMNTYARTGIDEDFHKGETAYDKWQGDPEVKPNPSLGPIMDAPFYAIELWPGNLGTFCGLVTDERARVLDENDTPIGGLYAVGGDMHPMLTGSYPGGGGSIGPAMTFGYIAARDLAGNDFTKMEDAAAAVA